MMRTQYTDRRPTTSRNSPATIHIAQPQRPHPPLAASKSRPNVNNFAPLTPTTPTHLISGTAYWSAPKQYTPDYFIGATQGRHKETEITEKALRRVLYQISTKIRETMEIREGYYEDLSINKDECERNERYKYMRENTSDGKKRTFLRR